MQNMAIYVINLARRPDRLENMARQLNGQGLEWSRIEAVDGRDPVTRLDEVAFVRPFMGKELTRAERACFLSHRNAWKTLIASDRSHAIVLEDDALIAPDFGDLARQGLPGAEVPGPIKIEYCEQPWNLPAQVGPLLANAMDGRAEIRQFYSRQHNATGYCFSRSVAQHLLEQTMRASRPVDFVLFDPLLFQSRFKSFVLVPSLVTLNDQMGSDIPERQVDRPGWLEGKRRFLMRRLQRRYAAGIRKALLLKEERPDWLQPKA